MWNKSYIDIEEHLNSETQGMKVWFQENFNYLGTSP